MGSSRRHRVRIVVSVLCGVLAGSGLTGAPAGATPTAPAVTRTAPRPCSAGLIALTFDDGPSAPQTPRLVRILLARHLPATFFMVGSRIRSAPAVAQLVHRSGFGIGNHTWSHPLLTDLSDLAVRKQLIATAREMRRVGIAPGTLMRPPYGGINARVRRDITGLGLVPVLWTIDSRDWAGGGPAEIAGRILAQLRPHATNIVLQHDGVNNSPNSISAVPLVYAAARRRGYCFGSLDDHGRVLAPVPQVSAEVVNGAEAGPTAVRVLLKLDQPTTRLVGLRIRTLGLSATPGTDFVPVSTRIGWAPGTLGRWVRIPVLPDSRADPTESFRIVLDGPGRLTIPVSTYLAQIAGSARGPVASAAVRTAAPGIESSPTPSFEPSLDPASMVAATIAAATRPPAIEPVAPVEPVGVVDPLGPVLRVGLLDPWVTAG